MLPNVRFIDSRYMTFSPELVRNSDIVWIQSNCISHPIRDAILALGIPCELSYSAGTFVCNDVLFTLLNRYRGTEMRVGFIHVPADGIPADRLSEALGAALKIIAGDGGPQEGEMT